MPRFTLCYLIPIMGLKPLLTATIPLFMNLFLNAFFWRVTQLWLHPGLFRHFLVSLKGTLWNLLPHVVSILSRKGDGFTVLCKDQRLEWIWEPGRKGVPWWLQNHVIKYQLYSFIISDPTITDLAKDWVEIIWDSGISWYPLGLSPWASLNQNGKNWIEIYYSIHCLFHPWCGLG